MAYSTNEKRKAVQIANEKGIDQATRQIGASKRSIQRWQEKYDSLQSNKDTSISKEQLIQNYSELMSRAALAGALGSQFNGKRDIYDNFGYPKVLHFERDYYNKYDRSDIGYRVVSAPPKATWRNPPTVTDDNDNDKESEFEQAWQTIVDNTSAYNKIKRADQIAGIGQFGVLLIGTKSNSEMPDSLESELGQLEGPEDIVYLSPFHQGNVDIVNLVTDPSNPRFGKPEYYKIDLGGDDIDGAMADTDLKEEKVHWSRVIHIAENLEENDIYGRPRMKNIYNRLMDLEKIAGGTAENFYQNSKQDYKAKAEPDYDFDPEGVENEFEEFTHGFRNILRLQGVDAERIQTKISDPSNPFDVIISLISAATGIPKRILLGSERGELASSQDESNWLQQIEERQNNFAEHQILRPLIDRLIEHGALPAVDNYKIEWPELFKLDEQEKSKTLKNKAEAANALVSGAASAVVDVDKFIRDELGLPLADLDTNEYEDLKENDKEVMEQFKKLKDN